MSKEKFLVVLNDGNREAIYRGVIADSMSDAMDICVEKHIKIYPDVDMIDIEGSCVKMAK